MRKVREKLKEKALAYMPEGISPKEKTNLFIKRYLDWVGEPDPDESILELIREYVSSRASGIALPKDEVEVLEICMELRMVSVYYHSYIPDPVKWFKDIITFWMMDAVLKYGDVPYFGINNMIIQAKRKEIAARKKAKDIGIELFGPKGMQY